MNKWTLPHPHIYLICFCYICNAGWYPCGFMITYFNLTVVLLDSSLMFSSLSVCSLRRVCSNFVIYAFFGTGKLSSEESCYEEKTLRASSCCLSLFKIRYLWSGWLCFCNGMKTELILICFFIVIKTQEWAVSSYFCNLFIRVLVSFVHSSFLICYG